MVMPRSLNEPVGFVPSYLSIDSQRGLTAIVGDMEWAGVALQRTDDYRLLAVG